MLAQAIAARRPLLALLVVIGGAGWPAALYPSRSIAYGVVILAAALWVLAGLRSARRVPALVAGTAIVIAAAAAASSAAVAKDGVLSWEQWSGGGPGQPVSVSYVWEGTYGGIEFPKKERTVLRITGPKRGLYWRATTLDQFDSDRWLENPTPLSTGPASGRLPNDPLLPTRSLNRSTWIRQDVEVVALRDTHVVAATQPVALDAPSLGSVFHLSDGLARAYNGLKRGQRYTVYSYAPRPVRPSWRGSRPSTRPRSTASSTSAAPASTRSASPAATGSWTASSRTTATSRSGRTRQCGRRRAGCEPTRGRPTAPSSRSRPGCARPEASRTTRTHRRRGGAAAGALRRRGQTRLLPALRGRDGADAADAGDPRARRRRLHERQVRGRRLDGDRPQRSCLGRGLVPGLRLAAVRPDARAGLTRCELQRLIDGFNAGDAADGFVRGANGVNGGGADQLRLLEQKEQLAEQAQAGRSAGDKGRSTLWLLVLLALAAIVALGLVKLVRRRSRYLTRDPRRLAGAARRELVDFLADQGIAVSASMTPDELHELLHAELGADGRPFAVHSRKPGSARRRAAPPPPAVRAESCGSSCACSDSGSAAGPPARPARAPLAAHVIPAVVIAAGLGTRLRPLSERYAKPVLPVDGTPVIAHLLRELAAAGAPHVTVVTGYRAEQIEQLIGDGGGFGVDVAYARQSEPDGSAHAVVAARATARTSSSEPISSSRPARSGASPPPTPARARPERSPSSRGRGQSRSTTDSSGRGSARACSRCRCGRSARPSPPGSRLCRDGDPSSSRPRFNKRSTRESR